MVLYSMFWFVFALYLANGHSDDTISPEPALEEFRCKEIFDQECSCDGFRPIKYNKKNASLAPPGGQKRRKLYLQNQRPRSFGVKKFLIRNVPGMVLGQ